MIDMETRTKIEELKKEMGEEGKLIRLRYLVEQEFHHESHLHDTYANYKKSCEAGKGYATRGISRERIACHEKELVKTRQEIRWLLKPLRLEDPKTLSPEQIQRAREYPISQILGTESSKINCPFHDDTHPSASIKNNKLHCFVCNETWDTISLVMKGSNLTFSEAVRRLL